MNKKLGFIGCGKMASAIIKGILSSEVKNKFEITGSEINSEAAESAEKRLGITVLSDNKLLATDSDVIFIATKPNYVKNVLEEIKDELTDEKLIVSIAAGISTKKITDIIDKHRVIRVMPNSPVLVKEGMSGICRSTLATGDDMEFVKELLSGVGKCVEVNEQQIDIVTAISGSGPAFFYKVIEDIARAGEKLGLEYETSLLLATQTAVGSARMIEQRGVIPVQTLIDNVATKGGCTFAGISVMNEKHSDRLFNEVIQKTVEKAHELGA